MKPGATRPRESRRAPAARNRASASAQSPVASASRARASSLRLRPIGSAWASSLSGPRADRAASRSPRSSAISALLAAIQGM